MGSRDTRTVRIVCVSDTHNDVLLAKSIPDGDIFIHAGDMTDNGTLKELEDAFNWISRLPHEVKIVIAGNHDFSLDPFHSSTTVEKYLRARQLFTSIAAKSRGIHYLDCQTTNISLRGKSSSDSTSSQSKPVTIPVYGNSYQPEFLPTNYAFTYPPPPSSRSEVAWESAPQRSDGVKIWVMHGGPKGRLDKIDIPPLEGCRVQSQKISSARPQLCVFGHFHVSYGVELVEFDQSDSVKTAVNVTHDGVYDFSNSSAHGRIKSGQETLFVNAAWMTGQKRQVTERNRPVVVDMDFEVD